MARRLTVVISQGQSRAPDKAKLEEDLVGGLLGERNIDVAVVPHLYDLKPDGTGMLCLQGIAGDMVVLSWLFPRAARWILARNRIRGHVGSTLLPSGDDDQEDEDDDEDSAEATAESPPPAKGIGVQDVPNRRIYCLDLRAQPQAAPYLTEIRRIAREATAQVVSLGGMFAAKPKPAPANGNAGTNGNGNAPPNGHGNGRFEVHTPAAGIASLGPAALAESVGPAGAVETIEPLRIVEETGRRWYPVIDYSRCTNCMECIDFCLFGVYGLDRSQNLLVEQPDNCKKGCPACSRVCPENAIIFPQHKTPGIAGSDTESAGGLKIDLSKLFGAPDAIEVAALERDRELVADGREAVGMTVGIPKRQSGKSDAPRDALDDLVDELDKLDL